MTTTEDQVRAGLRGLAPTALADEVAYRGVARRITHRRRRRTAARVTGVAALVAALAGAVALLPDGEQGADTIMQDQPGTRVSFAHATFELPPDWVVVWEEGQGMCVAPDEGVDEPSGCGLELLHMRPFYGEAEDGTPTSMPSDPEPVPGGTMPCPDGTSDSDSGDVADVVLRDPVEVTVGGEPATYIEAEGTCRASGMGFTIRQWELPDRHLLVKDPLGQPETDGIIASIELGEPVDDPPAGATDPGGAGTTTTAEPAAG